MFFSQKLFGSLNRCFPKVFHEFHEIESGFTGAGTGGFVVLNETQKF